MDEYAETLKDGIIIVEYISFLMFPLHFYVKYSYKVLGIRISFNSDLFIINTSVNFYRSIDIAMAIKYKVQTLEYCVNCLIV